MKIQKLERETYQSIVDDMFEYVKHHTNLMVENWKIDAEQDKHRSVIEGMRIMQMIVKNHTEGK